MWNIRNARNVISRFFGIRQRLESIAKARREYYARGVVSQTTSPSAAPTPKRWIYNSIRCDNCARVDRSGIYIMRGYDSMRRCLFIDHDYIPEGAVVDEDGELYVSPFGTTCHHFLSRAW